jgi:hypothetical protein
MKRVWLVFILVIAQISTILAPFRTLWAITIGDYSRALEVLKGYDRLGNAVTNGNSNETISSRANRARNENAKWGCFLCSILDKIENDHCKNSAGV